MWSRVFVCFQLGCWRSEIWLMVTILLFFRSWSQPIDINWSYLCVSKMSFFSIPQNGDVGLPGTGGIQLHRLKKCFFFFFGIQYIYTFKKRLFHGKITHHSFWMFLDASWFLSLFSATKIIKPGWKDLAPRKLAGGLSLEHLNRHLSASDPLPGLAAVGASSARTAHGSAGGTALFFWLLGGSSQ